MARFYNHLCACGCGRLLEVRWWHKYRGLPRYINGHQNIGRKHTPEEIEKMKVAHSTPEAIERSRVQGRANAGRKNTPEAIANMVAAANSPEALERSRSWCGDKSSQWQGGISFEEYPREFNDERKERIRERDGHVCQCCGRTKEEEGRELAVHHIDYDKRNCNDDNLITLCCRCNAKANGSVLKRHICKRVFQQKVKGNRHE